MCKIEKRKKMEELCHAHRSRFLYLLLKKKKNRRAQQRCVILCQKRKNVVANDVRLQNPIFLSDTSPCISFESHGWFAK